MKNLILILFFGLLMTLSLNCPVMAQETPGSPEISNAEENYSTDSKNNVEKGGFFHNIWNKAKEKATDGITTILFGFIAGIFAKHGWTLVLKRIANRGKVILKEIGEFAASGSTFLDTLDNKIRDDGTLAENSVKDLIEAGKPLIAEGKDVIISITPKKST